MAVCTMKRVLGKQKQTASVCIIGNVWYLDSRLDEILVSVFDRHDERRRQMRH